MTWKFLLAQREISALVIKMEQDLRLQRNIQKLIPRCLKQTDDADSAAGNLKQFHFITFLQRIKTRTFDSDVFDDALRTQQTILFDSGLQKFSGFNLFLKYSTNVSILEIIA